jgi:hypothetical protein
MRQRFLGKFVVSSLAVAVISVGGAYAENEGGHTLRVNCARGQSLNQALASSGTPLVVEFTGTCTGEVDIKRSDVTLRGGDASATVVAGPVLIEGQARVTLSGFTVRDAPAADIESDAGKCIRIENDQDMLLTGLKLSNCGNFGIDINASTGELSDSTVTHSGNVGVALNRNASFELTGTLTVTQGLGQGVVVSANAALEVQEEASMVTTDNQANGVLIELGGHITLHSEIIADRNGIGINVVDRGGMIYGDSHIEVANNRTIGIQIGQLADWTIVGGVVPNVQVFNNAGPGISVLRNAFVRLRENTTITGNAGPGLLVDGSGVAVRGTTITNNNGGHGDVVLNFGAQGTFDGGDVVGTPVSCDGTSRSRGQLVCTPTQ